MSDLTDQQRLLVNKYMTNGCNAFQAAVDAGYTETTARAHNPITVSPVVRAEVERRLSAADGRADIKVSEILTELKLMGLSDIADVLEDDGTGQPKLRAWGQIPKNVTKTLKKLKIKRWTEQHGDESVPVSEVTIDMHDKLGPLTLLARYLRVIGNGNDGDSPNTPTNVFVQNAIFAADSIFAGVVAGAKSNGSAMAVPE